jgi:hypothetical protein
LVNEITINQTNKFGHNAFHYYKNREKNKDNLEILKLISLKTYEGETIKSSNKK